MRTVPLMQQFRKHVCFVHATSEIGGAEKQSVVLAELLRDEGYKVSMAVFADTGPLRSICMEKSIPFFVLHFDWNATRASRLMGMLLMALRIRKIGPDILMPYCDLPNMYCGSIWKWTGAKKLIWNQRGVDTHCLRSRLARKALGNASAIISNSYFRKEQLAQNFDIPLDRIEVVYNAVSISESSETRGAIRRKLGLDDSTFVACMIANYVPRKRHDLLLKAWALFLKKPSNQRRCLLLVGQKYTYYEELNAFAASLHLTPENLVTLDYMENAVDYLAASNISVFTGDQEGLPNAILEAMALSKAVIAVDDPSNREALGEAGSRFLVASSPEAIADSLCFSINNPDVVRREGERNKRRVATMFTKEKLVRETIRIVGEC